MAVRVRTLTRHAIVRLREEYRAIPEQRERTALPPSLRRSFNGWEQEARATIKAAESSSPSERRKLALSTQQQALEVQRLAGEAYRSCTTGADRSVIERQRSLAEELYQEAVQVERKSRHAAAEPSPRATLSRQPPAVHTARQTHPTTKPGPESQPSPTQPTVPAADHRSPSGFGQVGMADRPFGGTHPVNVIVTDDERPQTVHHVRDLVPGLSGTTLCGLQLYGNWVITSLQVSCDRCLGRFTA